MSAASDALREFHAAFGVYVDSEPAVTIDARITLHGEEHRELVAALVDLAQFVRRDGRIESAERVYREAVARELADVMVVSYGTADLLGLDLDAAFAAVMRANMAKLPDCPNCELLGVMGPDAPEDCPVCEGLGKGPPRKREDGKVLRPDSWQPPDMSAAIR